MISACECVIPTRSVLPSVTEWLQTRWLRWRKPQIQTQVCGRSVNLLRHLICLVLPFRFDPNQNSMNLHVKFPLVQTKPEVSLVWLDPNCGLLCVWSVKKVETFRTNTGGCCRQRKGKTETWEETGGQNSSVKQGPSTLWSGRAFLLSEGRYNKGRTATWSS